MLVHMFVCPPLLSRHIGESVPPTSHGRDFLPLAKVQLPLSNIRSHSLMIPPFSPLFFLPGTVCGSGCSNLSSSPLTSPSSISLIACNHSVSLCIYSAVISTAILPVLRFPLPPTTSSLYFSRVPSSRPGTRFLSNCLYKSWC